MRRLTGVDAVRLNAVERPAGARLTGQQPPIENNGEPAALYAWMFLLLAAFGPGPWALERLLSAARREPRSAAAAEQATANA